MPWNEPDSRTLDDKYFIRPVFRVRDVAASVAYYCEKLGCSKRWEHGADGPIIAEVERGDLSVILGSGSVVPKPTGPSVLTLSIEDLSELYRELVGRGAGIRRSRRHRQRISRIPADGSTAVQRQPVSSRNARL